MDQQNSFFVKGHIIYSDESYNLIIKEDSYLLVLDGKVEGARKEIPALYKSLPIYDYGNSLVLPGFSDLHVHASQYPYRGVGGDYELLEWLKLYAFPEERKYKELSYAKKAYHQFVEDLKHSFTTRASIFATIHKEATLELRKQLEEEKLPCYVGLVNRNRNSPSDYREKDTETALKETEEFICSALKFQYEKPILTPRFTPSVTRDLREGLGRLREKYNLSVQSHLDENPSESKWVKELEPDCETYSDTYASCHRFGGDYNCIRAHCIYNNEKEINMLKENNVFVAHCPESNLNIASGMAPIRKYLNRGIKVGLGSDVAGGSSLSLLKAGNLARQVSKRYWRYIDSNRKPLQTKDVFAMATIQGGSFFGKTGSFLKGYDADIVVVDDSSLRTTRDLNLSERLERLFYLGLRSRIKAKFIQGNRIL